MKMMNAVNVTIRIEKETKRQFDEFCDNVGMNVTTALTMFIKTVLLTRQLPFTVTDAPHPMTREAILDMGKKAFSESRAFAVANGTSEMTIDEIDAEIAAYRQEKKVL
jgi:DNA-damage-inducible protein J